MDTAILLPYAPAPPRSRWRRGRRIGGLIALVAVTVWAGRTVYTRVKVLQLDPAIGPVDWKAVIRSPTALKVAWKLGGNPQAAADPGTFGAQPSKLAVTLAHPLDYQNGMLRLQVLIRNDGTDTVILPPLNTFGSIIPGPKCGTSGPRIGTGPMLGRGFRLLTPKTIASCPLAFPAPAYPTSEAVYVEILGSFFLLGIAAGENGTFGETSPHAFWQDVPESAISSQSLNDLVYGRSRKLTTDN